MNIQKLVVLTIILVMSLFPLGATAGTSASQCRFSINEGGHLDTDYGTMFMAEWWYLNGSATLEGEHGERRKVRFFVTVAHQESPQLVTTDGSRLSQLLHFFAFYPDDGPPIFKYDETYIPQAILTNYIAIHTPYVSYAYPDGTTKLHGTGESAYHLTQNWGDIGLNVTLHPRVDQTIDRATAPLNFITYEYAHGDLHGKIEIDGKSYVIKKAEGYFDHMIPATQMPWPMEMHGWTWAEVTNRDYQAVLYAIRSLKDGYGNYTYKHLTLINRHTGRVVKQFSGDQVTLAETDWIDEPLYGRKRPATIVVTAPDISVRFSADSVAIFNWQNPSNPLPMGFVDFMASQQSGGRITYRGETGDGNSFFEYLVSDYGLLQQTP